jgi:small-conductance mechanosensitive channel
MFFALALLAGPGRAQGQPAADPPAPAALSSDQIKMALDTAEAAINDENVSSEKLVELRETISTLALALRSSCEEIEPRAREIAERLKQLGPAPPKDGPPESQDVANERKQLTESSTEIEGDVKQTRLLLLRADQLGERISEKRHALYARELFARTQSILDPRFWIDAFNNLPVEGRRLDGLIAAWQETMDERITIGIAVAAVVSLVAILILTFAAGRWIGPRADGASDVATASRARWALRVFAWRTAWPSLPALAALFVLEAAGFLTSRVEPIAQAVVASVVIAAIGWSVATSLFAPRQPARRLAEIADPLAGVLYRFFVWAALALALTISLQAVHKAAFAPLIITVATNALFAAVAAGLLAWLVSRLGALKRLDVGLTRVQWVHPLALIMTTLISFALLVGFASFAAFMALRAVVAAVAFGTLYLLLEATKAFFAARDEMTARRQALAANIGITERGLGLAGTVLSGSSAFCWWPSLSS